MQRFNLVFSGVELRNQSWFVRIDTISLGLTIRSKINVNLLIGTVVAERLESGSAGAASPSRFETVTGVNFPQTMLNKLFRLIRLMKRNALRLETLTVLHKKAEILQVTKLHCCNERFHLLVNLPFQLALSVRGLLQNQRVKYSAYVYNKPQNSPIFFRKSLGLVDWDAESKLRIRATVHDLSGYHRHLADLPIDIRCCKLDVGFHFIDGQIKLDASSSILINQLALHPQLSVDLKDSDFVSTALLMTFQLEAVLALLPKLACNDLYKLRSTGEIGVKLMFAFLRNDPLTCKFNVDYDVSDVELLDAGIDMNYLNDPFSLLDSDGQVYHIEGFDRTASARSQSMLAGIINHVEDPNFYTHIGFDPVFIGRALAVNLATKRFKKGASTISMQLVKNIFLDERKNVARKVEEIVLALLLENYFKIDKVRIMDIYLQLVKFHVSTHGVARGASFYFGKSIDDLSLLEAIVLTYILPRPDFMVEAIQIQSPQLQHNLSDFIKRYFPFFAFKFGLPAKPIPDIVKFADGMGVIHLNIEN